MGTHTIPGLTVEPIMWELTQFPGLTVELKMWELTQFPGLTVELKMWELTLLKNSFSFSYDELTSFYFQFSKNSLISI